MKKLLQIVLFFLLVLQISFAQSLQHLKQSAEMIESKEKADISQNPTVSGEVQLLKGGVEEVCGKALWVWNGTKY